LVDRLSQTAALFLDGARQPLGLSLRGVERCVAVAATAAALDGARVISADHVREALEFRREALLV
jgi:predicted ATPase with chaperone activity